MNNIQKHILSFGADRCAALPMTSLVPEKTVLEACTRNLCGQYDRNYMCPPHIGTFEQILERLGTFTSGVLLQKDYPLADTKAPAAIALTKVDFHELILEGEAYLESRGIQCHWGMTGGHCILCTPCKAVSELPCAFPELARNSLEAIGVNVLSLAKSLGLDHEFHDDKIVWTGGLLWRE